MKRASAVPWVLGAEWIGRARARVLKGRFAEAETRPARHRVESMDYGQRSARTSPFPNNKTQLAALMMRIVISANLRISSSPSDSARR